ncbi:hypothetical protein IM538_14820 [Cytobacillus suaedae]|nr:hypothetical protein IM538_14820 [Cytobacillus suaedae]
MNYIEVSIEGDFWDYLFKDNLIYLWSFNGDICIYNWDHIVLDLTINNNNVSIYQLLQNKISRNLFKLINRNLRFNLTLDDIEPYRINKFDTPFKQLPISVGTYKDNFYAILDNGLYKAKQLNKSDSDIERLWDSKLFNFNIGKDGKIALAGGTEGLFEHFINQQQTVHVSKKHSTLTYWNKEGIYSSSAKNESYLAILDQNKNNNRDNIEIAEEDIFLQKVIHGGISWSSNKHFYRVFDQNKLEEVKFTHFGKKDKKSSKVIEFASWKGRLLSGGNASFGNVIECENALVVLYNNNDVENIPGDIVTWKVFNNNPYYLNHLGIVFEDKISIRGYQL